MADIPGSDDDIPIVWEDSFLASVEMDEDPLVASLLDDVITRGVARDKSRIRELRLVMRQRMIEEKGEEEIFQELNTLLESMEE
jgi:hypothetical protein